MKRGFTLLEIIVVIVILGIMATLAATSYTKMVEKARGGEAKIMFSAIRKYQIVNRLQTGTCSSVAANLGVGTEFPSVCASTHYFSYGITATGTSNTFTAVATRCTASGKNPNYSTTAMISLLTNFDNGCDSWTSASPY
jgi:prepilin-type N-terminal cleavage/methylation domain-containing protein